MRETTTQRTEARRQHQTIERGFSSGFAIEAQKSPTHFCASMRGTWAALGRRRETIESGFHRVSHQVLKIPPLVFEHLIVGGRH
jgi:hypothetical protein